MLQVVELFHAHLAGFLQLTRVPRKSCLTHHSPGRTSCPSAGLLIVTTLRHRTSVTRMMCSLSRVVSAGDSKVFLPSGAARGALHVQRWGVFQLTPSESPWARAPDLAKAPLHVPLPFRPPLVGHVDEPVAHDGVGVDFAAFSRAATGLIFNECSSKGGWCGWGGTRSAGVGNLLVCKRLAADVSQSADTMRKLMVAEDAPGERRSLSCCHLDGPRDFACLSGGQLRPTDRAMAAPLGPHVIERGRRQINRRGRLLADEALHREAVVKTLLWKNTLD